MRNKLIYSSFFVLLQYCTFLNGKNIVGQEVISKSNIFPYQASIRWNHNSDHHCSGTILNKLFLITAGHCVCTQYVKYDDLYVVVGANSFSDGGQQMSTIENAICHENFDLHMLRNDIALLKLGGKLKFNNRVRPLPLKHIPVPTDSILMMAVWRYTKNYTIPPKHFKLLYGNKVPLSNCSEFFDTDMVVPTNICIKTLGPGPCVGDSGGPVLYDGHLVGIISFGKTCNDLRYPNVHTNISNYIDWINMQIFIESY